MFVYFSIATMVVIVLIVGCLVTADHSDMFPILLMISGFWTLAVLLPACQATDRTIVSRSNPTEYRILKVDPYHSILLTHLNRDEPESFAISDSYTLHKIETGKFRVISHKHLNVWGGEVYRTTYFIKLTK